MPESKYFSDRSSYLFYFLILHAMRQILAMDNREQYNKVKQSMILQEKGVTDATINKWFQENACQLLIGSS